MIHCQAIYPSWFNIGDLAIASALIEIGFCYGGWAKDFYIDRSLHLLSIANWSFYSSKGEIVLDAVCHEALYFYSLDVEDKSAAEVLKRAKLAIAKTIIRQSSFSKFELLKRAFKAV